MKCGNFSALGTEDKGARAGSAERPGGGAAGAVGVVAPEALQKAQNQAAIFTAFVDLARSVATSRIVRVDAMRREFPPKRDGQYHTHRAAASPTPTDTASHAPDRPLEGARE